MKVFVTGVAGQLGHDVVNELTKRGHQAVGSDIAPTLESCASYVPLDITDAAAVEQTIMQVQPDAIVHCAAWTAVDAAEDEENQAKVRAINVDGTKHIADAAKKADAKMVYISTDYVFDGQGTRPWEPDDEASPLNAYGQSKYDGELALKKYVEKYFIVRISWVFGINGNNFIKTMLRLGRENGAVKVVDDQIGSPTYTYDLARLLVDMIESDRYGAYHATNEGICSWYEFAKEIFRAAGMDNVSVTPVKSGEFPVKAKRPKNSRMSKEKLVANGFSLLPAWQDAVARYINLL